MPKSMFDIYGKLYKVFRKKRFDLFVRVIKPTRSDALLDVGGAPWFWTAYPACVGKIDSLNVDAMDWDESRAPEHHIRAMVGDGCALDMPAQSYDIGFSNSCIEHVGPLDKQRQFAAEIRRVGQAIWVQTPARESILEPHYMTLFVQHFPRPVKRKLIRWLSLWGLFEKPSQERIDDWIGSINLLTKSQMRELFPDCEILTERILGIFPKSYIAVRRTPRREAPAAGQPPVAEAARLETSSGHAL